MVFLQHLSHFVSFIMVIVKQSLCPVMNSQHATSPTPLIKIQSGILGSKKKTGILVEKRSSLVAEGSSLSLIEFFRYFYSLFSFTQKLLPLPSFLISYALPIIQMISVSISEELSNSPENGGHAKLNASLESAVIIAGPCGEHEQARHRFYF